MHEELIRTEFDGAFCQNSNFWSIDFLHFFPKRRKSVDKMIHQKKSGVTERPRLLNPGKALAMAICPIICLFYELARTPMDDVACEFACAVSMRRNN